LNENLDPFLETGAGGVMEETVVGL